MNSKGHLGGFLGGNRENGLPLPCGFARSRSRLLALRDRSRLVLEQMSEEYLGESERRGGGERGAGRVPRPRKLCMR